ncbi:MAG: 4'-phosphopantetheinyl transferase superfamily protein [Bacteroidales bacterium]|nr:4'-phosphopantetheinyl transferase superfamily protein [Bacteroidales bacterium]
MILVAYTKVERELPEEKYFQLIAQLPPTLAKKNFSYKRWEDRHLNLFGKMLLMDTLEMFGFGADSIHHLSYNQYGKPCFPDKHFDFNISHSGHYVVCAASSSVRIGIDIEGIRKIDFDDFRSVMSCSQWQIIENSENPVRTFYRFWTIKESVLKADSRGLSIPLNDIQINNGVASCQGSCWHVYDLFLDEGYMACVASASPVDTIRMSFLSYY